MKIFDAVRALLAAALSEKSTTPDEPSQDEALTRFDELFRAELGQAKEREEKPALKLRVESYEEIDGGYERTTWTMKVDPKTGDQSISERSETVESIDDQPSSWKERISAEREQRGQETGIGA